MNKSRTCTHKRIFGSKLNCKLMPTGSATSSRVENILHISCRALLHLMRVIGMLRRLEPVGSFEYLHREEVSQLL